MSSPVRRGVLAAVVVYIAYRIARFAKWQREFAKRFPGPPVSLLTGNISEVIKHGGFTEELFFALHGQYGDVVRFFLFPNLPNLSIANPDLVEELYKKARTRPAETYLFLWYLGKENLLFQTDKDLVKNMRLIYGTMITKRSQLDKLHAVSMREFRAQVDKWAFAPSDTPRELDLFAALGPVIYDVMGQVMFDSPWLVTDLGQKVYAIHKHLIEDVNKWLLYPVYPPPFHPGFFQYKLKIREWRSLVGGIIDKRAKDMRENPSKYENDESAITTILSSKTKDGKPFFSRERAISTMCGFLNGAYDTTHSTSFWMFFFLSKHPECQRKILDEFSRLNIPAEPTVDQLRECEYLHAFLMESMRMRSTVPVNQRINLEEDIEIGGWFIPKGTCVDVPNGVIAKDERWFGREPEAFRPERFMGDTDEAKRAIKSWMAFGGHTRMCVGFTFALVEMKAMLHTILTRASVELVNPNEGGEFKIEAGVNQPINHFPFYFRQRDMRKLREEEAYKWWLAQTDALDGFKDGKPNVAQAA